MASSFPSASVPMQSLRAVVDGSDPTVTLTRPFNIVDMVVQPTASNSSGTVKLQRSTDAGSTYSDVTDAVAAATSGTLGRAATVVAAQAAFASTNVLKLLRANSAQAICYIYVQPTAISGNA